MQALRLNEVLMRVVAWHNRHPLARRITATQVHSIGEVVLPFVSAQALAATAGLPTLPRVADLLDPPQILDTPSAAPGAFAAHLAATRANAAARQTAQAHHPGDAGAAGDHPLADRSGEPANTASNPLAAVEVDLALTLSTPVHAPAPGAAWDEVQPDPSVPVDTPPAPGPAARIAPATASRLPGWLVRMLARLSGRQPGMPALRPAFSRNFIWPLSPRQVARWARRHGQLWPVAPTDWPRRVVETDGRLLGAARRAGLTHPVSLHLLTAAIGVDDRRLRVLMDAQGAILGPRAYSRPRMAIAGGLVLASVLGTGGSRWLPALHDPVPGLAMAGPSASAPAGMASAAVATAATEVGLTPSAPLAAQAAAGSASVAGSPDYASAGVALAAAMPSVPSPASDRLTRPTGQGERPALPAPAPIGGPAEAQATVADAELHPTPATDASPAPSGAPAIGEVLGRIRPQLSAEDRLAAREQAAALRGAAAAPTTQPPQSSRTPPAQSSRPEIGAPTATVYAVVTRPDRLRDSATRSLALMQSAGAKLPPPVPTHGELMQSQGSWRAAWWPFATLADAERARVLLVGKGVKAEVVEF